MQTWTEVAHKAFEDANDEPIKGNATNLAKFGAPAVAIVTALLTGLFGESWNLDPKRDAVVIAAAVVVAAVVVGVYHAFASDIRTRGAVTIARFEAIARLEQEERRLAERREAEQRAREASEAKASDERIVKLEAEIERLRAAATAATHNGELRVAVVERLEQARAT